MINFNFLSFRLSYWHEGTIVRRDDKLISMQLETGCQTKRIIQTDSLLATHVIGYTDDWLADHAERGTGQDLVVRLIAP